MCYNINNSNRGGTPDMLVSASRRTDIPAFYSEWFLNRVREGYALVRNPFNPKAVSRIELTSELVDGILFWSKNPEPILPKLKELDGFAPYYFQFTLTGYRQEVEPFKTNDVTRTFIRLSDMIGANRVIWRYDPIFLSPEYTKEFHLREFERLCKALAGRTNSVTISFIVRYRSILSRLRTLNLAPITDADKSELAERFVIIASEHGIKVNSCAEETDLSQFGVGKAKCMDESVLESVGGVRLSVPKDKTQRVGCNCSESVDLGEYSTCRNYCVYCYANHNSRSIALSEAISSPDSPLIVGRLAPDDKVTLRRCVSYADAQMRM
jgi:hypothetical protein